MLASDVPFYFRWILNVCAYIVYTFVVSFAFSFIFPVVCILTNKPIPNGSEPFFTKVQILIAILVLILTFIYKKYFYFLGEYKTQKVTTKTYKLNTISACDTDNSTIDNTENISNITTTTTNIVNNNNTVKTYSNIDDYGTSSSFDIANFDPDADYIAETNSINEENVNNTTNIENNYYSYETNIEKNENEFVEEDLNDEKYLEYDEKREPNMNLIDVTDQYVGFQVKQDEDDIYYETTTNTQKAGDPEFVPIKEEYVETEINSYNDIKNEETTDKDDVYKYDTNENTEILDIKGDDVIEGNLINTEEDDEEEYLEAEKNYSLDDSTYEKGAFKKFMQEFELEPIEDEIKGLNVRIV